MFALIKDSDNTISSISDVLISENGHTCVDLNTITINGDAVPEDNKEMTRGSLTGSGPYTYSKPVQTTEEARKISWDLTRAAVPSLDWSTLTVEEKLVVQGEFNSLTDAQWTTLIAKYS